MKPLIITLIIISFIGGGVVLFFSGLESAKKNFSDGGEVLFMIGGLLITGAALTLRALMISIFTKLEKGKTYRIRAILDDKLVVENVADDQECLIITLDYVYHISKFGIGDLIVKTKEGKICTKVKKTS